MSLKTSVQLGYTFEYFIPGVILLIIGGIFFLVNSMLAILIILTGTSFLLLKTGIEIDQKTKDVRKFYSLFSLRFGGWIRTVNLPTMVVALTNTSKQLTSRGSSRTSYTGSYDVVFCDEKGSKRELNDFRTYDKALQLFNLINEQLALQHSRNEVKEAHEKAAKNRRERKNGTHF